MLRLEAEPGTVAPGIGCFKAPAANRTSPRSFCRLALLFTAVLLVGCARLRPTQEAAPESRLSPTATARPAVHTQDELRAMVAGANVVICVIDAARADHIGCYGYPRLTTPSIDRLSAEALTFENHFCQAPMTKLSTTSLLTGLYPDTHTAYEYRKLRPGTFTLATALRSAGLRSAFVSANLNASPRMGIGGDFEFTATMWEFGRERVNPEQPALGTGAPEGKKSRYCPSRWLDTFSRWLADNRDSPFCAYLHLMPPHKPYAAPKKLKRIFAGENPPTAWQGDFPFPGLEPEAEHADTLPLGEWVNLYDANLRWADEGVAQLVRLLSRFRLLDNTLLIVTSDHGEAFGEHGYIDHNRGVYDELLHIPLLLRFPGGAVVGRVPALTQTVDILPTICDLLEVPCPDTVQGRSLLPLIAGDTDSVNDYVFARCCGETPSYLVRTSDHALMLYQGGRLRCLFDLKRDPRQLANVIDEKPEEAERLVGVFRGFLHTQTRKPVRFLDPNAKEPPPEQQAVVQISEDTRRELRALGYLQ